MHALSSECQYKLDPLQIFLDKGGASPADCVKYLQYGHWY